MQIKKKVLLTITHNVFLASFFSSCCFIIQWEYDDSTVYVSKHLFVHII